MLPTWINQHRQIVVAAAALVMALSLMTLWMSFRPPRGQNISGAWCYNLSTGELFAASIGQLPPVETPQGTGVRAYVFACGRCGQTDQFIQSLEKYDDDARAAAARAEAAAEDDPALARAVEQGRFVAAAPAAGQPPQWVPAADPRAADIVRPDASRCGDRKLVACWP